MKRGEVWWVEFDPSIGSEIRKTRPVVIVSNDAANRNLERVVVIPMNGKINRVYTGETIVMIVGKQSKVMADQIMMADKVRLKSQIAALSKAEMFAIDDIIRIQLPLPK